jgi:hypothetical protein
VADDRWAVSTGQRKVRTPSGSMPCKTRGRREPKLPATESVTENQTAGSFLPVRVKRRGKSPPPGEQSPGHEKPHAVQDKTGSLGRLARLPKGGGSRVLVAPAFACERGAPLRRSERNDHHGRPQGGPDRIRLIATRAFFLEGLGIGTEHFCPVSPRGQPRRNDCAPCPRPLQSSACCKPSRFQAAV